MAITYTTPWPGLPGVKIPELHRVVYAHTVDGVASTFQISLKDVQVREWCQDNCVGRWYMHPGWTTEKFVDFEDSTDAVMFTLKWLK